MKKLFLLTALIGIMLSSCKNDAIDIDVKNTPEPKVSLTLNISTTSGYESFNIEKYKSEYLTDKDPHFIGVKSFLYDASGNIVDSESSHIKTFNQVSQSFNGLMKGNYTVVTIETLVNSDYNYTSDYWYIDGADRLSTLTLMLDTAKVSKKLIGSGAAVAISSKLINVSTDMTESVAPAPIGAMVNTYYVDFEKSKNVLVAFYTKNQPIGMFINPSIPISEKYIYEKNLDKNTFVIRGYVYSDTGFASQEYERTVYILEQGKVQWCFGSSTKEQLEKGKFWEYPRKESYVTFEDGKYFYAGFCYVGGAENNDCEAFLGNSESEVTNWYNNLDKSKQASKDLYKEPYLSWGGNVADVKSYMGSYTLESDIQLGSDGSYFMQYRGLDNKKNEMVYRYDFKQSTTGLEAVYVLLNGSKTKEDEIKTHLTNNGYVFSKYNEASSLSVYESSKSVVGYSKSNTGNYVVLYMEKSSNSRTRTTDVI